MTANPTVLLSRFRELEGLFGEQITPPLTASHHTDAVTVVVGGDQNPLDNLG
jgi:hypothetical protein